MLILLGSVWYDADQFIRDQTLFFDDLLPICTRHYTTLVARFLTSGALEKNSKLFTLDLPC